MFKLFVLTSILLSQLNAAPAFSRNKQFTQPDGETFIGKVKGDEYLHYIETSDGEIVLFNKQSKNYDYAIIESKNNKRSLAPSGFKVQSYSKTKKMRSNPFKKITQEQLNELYMQNKMNRAYIPMH